MTPIIFIILLTLISGWADSQGFIHAAKIWKDNALIWKEVRMSVIGFSIGISSYFLAIRYLNQIGIVSPEVQTIGWFVVTIIGVALTSGQFFKWTLIDQLVASVIVMGLAWLLFHVKT